MKQYNKYLIGPADRFDAGSFAGLDEEIYKINKESAAFPSSGKVSIIISYLKDHSVQTNWITENPDLAKLISSGSLFTGCIESLFDSCRNNLTFRHDLEEYLSGRLKETS